MNSITEKTIKDRKQSVVTKIQKGLSSQQIKIIALISMTIDHIAAYGFEHPIIFRYYGVLRGIGRLAAPLFLFMLLESIKKTESKKRLALRLYLGAVFTGLTYAFTNLFAEGIAMPDNIMFTLLFISLYIFAIEQIKERARKSKVQALLFVAAVIAISFALVLIVDWTYSGQSWLRSDLAISNFTKYQLLADISRAFIAAPLYVPFSWLFVLMGVLLYFAKNRIYQAMIFLGFCGLSYFGFRLHLYIPLCPDFLGGGQHLMIFSLVIYMLYNEERGGESPSKLFFYAYYPLHQMLLRFLLPIALAT